MIQQPVLTGLANDLAPEGEHGRYNAIQIGTF
jgi:hypothetical protein